MPNKKNTRSVSKLPMDKAAAVLFNMGLTSYYQYTQLCASGNRPDYLPSNLSSYYNDYPGWDKFIKLGELAAKSNNTYFGVTYSELKYILKRKNISSKSAFLKAHRSGELPPGTPLSPDSYYSEFEGWDLFLPKKAPKIGYEEAKKIIHPHMLKSSYQWRNFCRDGHKPDGIPVLPDRDYDEFVSWEDFLGYKA